MSAVDREALAVAVVKALYGEDYMEFLGERVDWVLANPERAVAQVAADAAAEALRAAADDAGRYGDRAHGRNQWAASFLRERAAAVEAAEPDMPHLADCPYEDHDLCSCDLIRRTALADRDRVAADAAAEARVEVMTWVLDGTFVDENGRRVADVDVIRERAAAVEAAEPDGGAS